jgi:hypothetical protein
MCAQSCSWALTDIKCGLLNTETLIDAREVARRVGKGGKGLERTCDMTEVLAAVDGSHSTVSFEEAPMLATALTEAVSDGCGGEAALSGSAYLVLGSALHRLGQRAANAPANMGTSMGTWASHTHARTHTHTPASKWCWSRHRYVGEIVA